MNLKQALESYSSALAILEETQSQPSANQILAVLHARDAVQQALLDEKQDKLGDLARVIELDQRLKALNVPITQKAPLPDWRASLRPSEEAWWWFLEVPPDRWNRLDWLWTALTILCLTISLGLVVDISSRFLAGGPDTWAALTVVAQSVLTLLTAGGALTLAGQEAIKRILMSLNVSSYFWQEAKLIFAISVLGALVMLRSSLPSFAVWYNNQGVQNYKEGRLTSAQSDYVRAIKLNPDYVEAHYNLGVLYEDLQQMDRAQTEYLAAVQGGLAAAHNNLARLNILDENYSAAIPLLKKGLLLTTDNQIRYDLYKNLGWARLEQARHDEAIADLQSAIDLSPKGAPAHCLLAQALEGRDDQTGAQEEWKMCQTYADPLKPDEDKWIGMARERLPEADE